MERMIDMHAHILPCVDDGAASTAEAIQLLTLAYAQGIRTIVATPHYSRRQDMNKIKGAFVWLQEEAWKLDKDFQIYLGQEILYFDSVVEKLKEGQALTMGGSRYVLVEFKPNVQYKIIYQAVRSLFQSGYCPIIAHIERYRVLRIEENLLELLKTDCCFQMNYKSLNGGLWDRDASWCRKQVRTGKVHCLSTDMHDSGYRTPEVTKALKWMNHHLETEQRKQLIYKNAEIILQNGQLPDVYVRNAKR